MELLKITERAARVLVCCEMLERDMDSEEHQRALASALDALAQKPPEGPPIIVGLFNQSIALSDATIFRITQVRRAPTPDAIDAVRHSIKELKVCVFDLHSAAASRAGFSRRLAPSAVDYAPPSRRRY